MKHVIGEIVYDMGIKYNKAPKGWMECNGQTLDVEDYPELAKSLKAKTKKFSLPKPKRYRTEYGVTTPWIRTR